MSRHTKNYEKIFQIRVFAKFVCEAEQHGIAAICSGVDHECPEVRVKAVLALGTVGGPAGHG